MGSDDKKENSSQDETYLSPQESQDIVENYQLFQIPVVPEYSDPYQFANRLQRVGILQYEGLQFFTSGNSLVQKI